MTPVSFGHCFGWLHKGASARGVVLMSPFGFEELCARKPYTLLAQALVARGLSVLRFDWSGTGDSLGGPLDPRLFEQWQADAQAAIDTLKKETGVSEIIVVGMRLGALIAAQAAAARSDIARAVLIAPPASGKAWLRETAAFARMMSPDPAPAPGFDGLECAGFRLSAETIAAIKPLSWMDLPGRPAPFVDILAGSSGHAGALEQTMLALGAQVTNGVFAGYDAMMCDPTASEIPLGTIEAIAARLAAQALPGRATPEPAAFVPLAGHGFTEAPALIGDGAGLAGILATPIEAAPRGQAVILLNAGAIHHVGWGRMHVDLARRLARHGVACLRLDLPGIGDSATLTDPPVASLYARKMSAEVSQAIGWLKARGYRSITLAGACSGAYQAFHAALADERADALVLLNQLCFAWGASYSMQFTAWQSTKARTMQAQMAQEDQAEQMAAARTLAAFLPVARKIAKGSLSALMSLQTLAANAMAREKPVEAAFMKLSARGVRVLLAYSAGDAGLSELERHMGPEGVHATALPGVEKIIIDNADHMLTPVRAREVFGDSLVDFLDRAASVDLLPGERRAGVA